MYHVAAKLRHEVLHKHRQATIAAAYSRGICQFTLYHAHYWAGLTVTCTHESFLDHCLFMLLVSVNTWNVYTFTLSTPSVNTIRCMIVKKINDSPILRNPLHRFLILYPLSNRFGDYHVYD